MALLNLVLVPRHPAIKDWIDEHLDGHMSWDELVQNFSYHGFSTNSLYEVVRATEHARKHDL